MELNRKYRPLTSRRQHESPIDRKIRQLEEISQNQSRQVKQLLHHQVHQLPSQIKRSKPTKIHSPQRSFEQSKPQTARKRYHYEDFLQRQHLATNYTKRGEFKRGQDMPLAPAGFEILADRQIDQQMQYLKSEEYRKYLERVAQGSSTHEKVRIIKQSRNHNVYLGKTHRQTSYFQRSINYPPLSPIRTSSKSFYNISPRHISRQHQIVESQRAKEYRKSPLHEKIKTSQYQQPDKNYLPYIRLENQQQQPPLTPRNPTYNHKVDEAKDLSPFAIEKFDSQERSLQKQIKKQCINLQQPSPRIQNLQKNVTPALRAQEKKACPVKQMRVDTYRKQVQFCNNRQSKIKRKSNEKKHKNNHQYSYNFKILDKDKVDDEEKSQPQRRSYSSSPSQKGVYQISFKINKPDRSKSPYQQPKDAFKPKKTTNTNLNKYYPVKNKQNYQKQVCKKLITQPVNQCFYRPLQESQTNSTAAKTDNLSKSSRKISLISKSKLK